MTSISIPNSVTRIEQGAFENCSKMTNLTLKDGDENDLYIFSTAFENVPLETIHLGRNTNSGYITTGHKNSLKKVTIGDMVTKIKNGLFSDCIGLTSLSVPNNVTSIEANSFKGCTGLTSIDMGSGLKNIGNNAFEGCTGFTSITLGNDVNDIGNCVFKGCVNLNLVNIGSQVQTIGERAFEGCSSITKLISFNTIPPQCGSNALFDIDKWNCTLQVPKASIDEYKNANQWKDFFFIEETTGIKKYYTNKSSINQIYDLNGKQINQLNHDINIIKMNNGMVRKVKLR